MIFQRGKQSIWFYLCQLIFATSPPILPGKWESYCKPEKKLNNLLIGIARLVQR